MRLLQTRVGKGNANLQAFISSNFTSYTHSNWWEDKFDIAGLSLSPCVTTNKQNRFCSPKLESGSYG